MRPGGQRTDRQNATRLSFKSAPRTLTPTRERKCLICPAIASARFADFVFDHRLKFSLLSLRARSNTSRSIYAQICRLCAAFYFCCCLLGSAKFIEYAFRRQVLVGIRDISGG